MILNLNECANCGGNGEVYMYDTDGCRLYFIRCEDCGNGTCADEVLSEVVRLWNARPSDEEAVKMIYISLPNDMNADKKYAQQKRLSEDASDYLCATVELVEFCPDSEICGLEVLASRLKAMNKAEYVIFPDGWELERESRIEHEAAIEYGKKILLEHGEKMQEENKHGKQHI